MTDTYNPLERQHLGASVSRALLERPATPLGELKIFPGAGIYVIYYKGDFPAYKLIAKANKSPRGFTRPIYVGKAIPAGGRIGVEDTAKVGNPMFNRLQEHAESIEHAENLSIEDFSCRYLVTEDIWIPLGESLLIQKFKPVWNIIGGYGNHDPGGGRYKQKRSAWDVIHPGRAWALKCAPNGKLEKQLLAEVEHTVAANAPDAKLFD